MRKMKIVFVGFSDYSFPYTRVRCYNFAQELKKHGVDAQVLSYQADLAPQFKGSHMYSIGDRDKLLTNLRAMWRLRDKSTILYVQKAYYHTAGPFLLSRLFGHKFILDYDDWDIDRAPFFQRGVLNQLFFKKRKRIDIIENIAKNAFACIAASSKLKEYLSRFSEKVFYVPTGVDVHKFKANTEDSHSVDNKKSKTEIIAFWSGDVWGDVMFDIVLFILHSFSTARREVPELKLRLVCFGNMISRVRDVINKLYSDGGVELIEHVHPDKMPEVMQDIDIGLMPLIPDDANRDWMESKSPTKFFEYMSMGKATVTSAFGEVKNIVEDGIDGFLASDLDDFTKKFITLAKDKELREKMGKLAREKVVSKYSLEVLGKSLFSILTKDLMLG
ncbi:glycosyltransferase family 4 protein [bacterium]|nr:glycosyltransferase family 4 protein [bacterium]